MKAAHACRGRENVARVAAYGPALHCPGKLHAVKLPGGHYRIRPEGPNEALKKSI